VSRGIGTTQRAILGELAKQPIEAWPQPIPVVELAQRLGCSDRQIRRAVHSLAERVLVAPTKEPHTGRQGQSLMVWDAITYAAWMDFISTGPGKAVRGHPPRAAEASQVPEIVGLMHHG
jgi:hypothetical protein